jgi:CheY-like chemotaxis protein
MPSILLIDDDEDVRITTSELLRSDGYRVDTAEDARVGLALYKAWLYDLVITDIVMPEMDGLELIEALRNTTPRPRVIAISGDAKYSEPHFLLAAMRLGAERIIAKPVLPDVLLQTVDDVLAKPAPASSLPHEG